MSILSRTSLSLAVGLLIANSLQAATTNYRDFHRHHRVVDRAASASTGSECKQKRRPPT